MHQNIAIVCENESAFSSVFLIFYNKYITFIVENAK